MLQFFHRFWGKRHQTLGKYTTTKVGCRSRANRERWTFSKKIFSPQLYCIILFRLTVSSRLKVPRSHVLSTSSVENRILTHSIRNAAVADSSFFIRENDRSVVLMNVSRRESFLSIESLFCIRWNDTYNYWLAKENSTGLNIFNSHAK